MMFFFLLSGRPNNSLQLSQFRNDPPSLLAYRLRRRPTSIQPSPSPLTSQKLALYPTSPHIASCPLSSLHYSPISRLASSCRDRTPLHCWLSSIMIISTPSYPYILLSSYLLRGHLPPSSFYHRHLRLLNHHASVFPARSMPFGCCFLLHLVQSCLQLELLGLDEVYSHMDRAESLDFARLLLR